jgi:hypothetical protein
MLSDGQQTPLPVGMQLVPQRTIEGPQETVHALLEQVSPLGQSPLVQQASFVMHDDPQALKPEAHVGVPLHVCGVVVVTQVC